MPRTLTEEDMPKIVQETTQHLSTVRPCSGELHSQSPSLQGQSPSAGLSAPDPQSLFGSCPFEPSDDGSRSAHLAAPETGNPAQQQTLLTGKGLETRLRLVLLAALLASFALSETVGHHLIMCTSLAMTSSHIRTAADMREQDVNYGAAQGCFCLALGATCLQ